MSGADYFTDVDAINDLMDPRVPVDVAAATAEHAMIAQALTESGVCVKQVPPPYMCQDGVYTANWALVRSGKALLSRLPNTRRPEEAYARQVLTAEGLETLTLPAAVSRFSGQGDALVCGEIAFVHSPYRTTTDAHPYLRDWMGFREVVALETKPARWFGIGPPKRNRVTGLPDSPTYDLDLALAILKPPTDTQKALIAFCPDVFTRASRELLNTFRRVDKIEVTHHEALGAFALNLVSTGDTVVMNSGAPQFEATLRAHGLRTKALDLPELRKGGGSIRCTTLTLDD